MMPRKAKAAWGGALLILAAALFWSTGGAGIKRLDGFSPWAVSGGRSILCALFLWGLSGWRIRPSARGAWPWVAAGAAIYAFVVTSFVVANRLTSAANAILLQYTAPLWIAAAGWVGARRERPSGREWAALGAGLLGVGFCVGEGATFLARGGAMTRGLLGDAISLASGVAFAAITLVVRRLNRHHAPGEASANSPIASVDSSQSNTLIRPRPADDALLCLVLGNVLAALLGVPALIAELPHAAGVPGKPLWVGWCLLLWLGWGQLGAGYWFFQRGLRTTRALTASLLCLVEPVLNPVWVACVIGERPARGTLIGGVFVLVSVGLSLTARSGRETNSAPNNANPG